MQPGRRGVRQKRVEEVTLANQMSCKLASTISFKNVAINLDLSEGLGMISTF